MQKTIFTLLLLSFSVVMTAQKPIMQQAGYIGINLRSLSFCYDARFRNSGTKPDFSVGAGLDLPTSYYYGPALGVKAHGSMLLGKSSSSFEVGTNFSLNNSIYDYYNYNNERTKLPMQGEANFFVGYRLQPKNKHFILQIQHHLVGIASPYHHLAPYTPFNYYTPMRTDLIVYSPYTTDNYGKHLDWSHAFTLKIGCNINTIAKEGEELTAYEAPKGNAPDLQHAFAGDLHLRPYFTRLGAAYDLRWRRQNQVDFALNLGLASGMANSTVTHYQALAVFGEGKGCMEAGLGGVTFSNARYQINSVTAIGIPIGFRYQPRKGFYFRASMTTLKVLTTQQSDTVFDTMDLGTSFGYTF
jgi:hypothetical protein